MESSCYQCGSAIESGVKFCPQCDAPQIRVGAPVSATTSSQAVHKQSPVIISHGSVVRATRINWSQGLPAAMLAGLISALVMMIPLGGFGIGMLLCGALAVVFYRRRNQGIEVVPALGWRLGAVSGMIGFAILSVLFAISTAISHSGGELRTLLLQAVQQAAERSNDPETIHVFDSLRTPQGMAALMIASLIFMCLVFLVVSSIGGALGAVLLGTKKEWRKPASSTQNSPSDTSAEERDSEHEARYPQNRA